MMPTACALVGAAAGVCSPPWRCRCCKPRGVWPMRCLCAWVEPGVVAESTISAFLDRRSKTMHPQTLSRSGAQSLSVVALCAALMAVLGLIPKIDLPFGVPITLQSLGGMLAGCLLGGKRGFQSLALFLLAVAVGLPLLSGGRGGIGVFMLPSAGYLIGLDFVEKINSRNILIHLNFGALSRQLLDDVVVTCNRHRHTDTHLIQSIKQQVDFLGMRLVIVIQSPCAVILTFEQRLVIEPVGE